MNTGYLCARLKKICKFESYARLCWRVFYSENAFIISCVLVSSDENKVI